MSDQYTDRFSRNIGVLTNEEQKKLRETTVGIAGVGGVGGLLAERLLRMGIGRVKLSDPGDFEVSNLNRQFGSDVDTLGRKKAEVVAEQIRLINPDASIEWDVQGIESSESAETFVRQCDLVIDEMDYGAWKESIYLQRAARNNGIHYLFSGAIGFGALLSNFAPDGITLEEYNGLTPGQDLESIQVGTVASDKVLPVVPTYASHAMPMEMVQEILQGLRPVPTCSVGVGLAAVLAANEAVNTILKRMEIAAAPEFIYIDLMDKVFRVGALSSEKQ